MYFVVFIKVSSSKTIQNVDMFRDKGGSSDS